MPKDEKRFEEERGKYIVTLGTRVYYMSLTSSQVNLLVWLENEGETEELSIKNLNMDFIEL